MEKINFKNNQTPASATTMSTFQNNIENAINISNSYYKEEKQIGFYYDGKPIFRKLFTGTTSSSSGTNQLLTGVDKIVNIGGYLQIPGGIAKVPNYYDGTNNINIDLNMGAHVLNLNVSSSYYSRSYEIWIDYTKV